jgi:hypothetical protein
VDVERHSPRATVYNFEVADNHTYFVGNSGRGLWVHNASAGSPIPGNPRFIAPSDGPAIEIPPGYVGRVADNGRGQVWQLPGSTGNANSVRIMDPTPPSGPSPGYPNGYVRIMNPHGQPIDPATGRPGSKATSHIPIKW